MGIIKPQIWGNGARSVQWVIQMRFAPRFSCGLFFCSSGTNCDWICRPVVPRQRRQLTGSDSEIRARQIRQTATSAAGGRLAIPCYKPLTRRVAAISTQPEQLTCFALRISLHRVLPVFSANRAVIAARRLSSSATSKAA